MTDDRGRDVNTSPDVPALIAALWDVCTGFGADAASASYVSPEGVLVTLQVTAGGLVTLEDDDGHLVAVPLGASA